MSSSNANRTVAIGLLSAICASAVIYYALSYVMSSEKKKPVKKSKRVVKEEEKAEPVLTSCTVSAPGKALIAGGYLVLDTGKLGLVIGASARFHTTAYLSPRKERNTAGTIRIAVNSIQFHQQLQLLFNTQTDVLECIGSAHNEFIEKCVHVVLLFVKGVTEEAEFARIMALIGSRKEMVVLLRADNDFYSQISSLQSRRMTIGSDSLRSLERFRSSTIQHDGAVKIAKTGMGSSAALTTSLVAALLEFFGVIKLSLRKANDRRLVHNLSQIAHALAQGKIGSGFDVAAAVYGSVIYSRFNPLMIAGLSEQLSPSVVYEAVTNPSAWDQTITEFTLPAPLDLMMGDVSGGSNSVAMSRTVLDWLNGPGEEAGELWAEIAQVNTSICSLFRKLSDASVSSPVLFKSSIKRAGAISYEKWNPADPVESILLEIKHSFRMVRKLLKTMGEKSGVDIEPEAQTQLVDATDAAVGVLCAGVPGAGGVDAIFCIVFSETARLAVESVWAQWQGTIVCPLLVKSDTGAESGVRMEPLHI